MPNYTKSLHREAEHCLESKPLCLNVEVVQF